ncbi:hypothetical protein Pflav_049500 [Phytohabitans flavus]|uniref:Uncharacterized protein n=1 Tax=Phytohabitans flavus TaxID=1076124 RepID=A0A6F8XXK3_9ACTN|nr:hypothetical protein Pflav_049500 [Phytohabitans flavus]
MVSVLVGQHVRLRELARRAELVGELLVEGQVDVHVVVRRAVERPHARVGRAAPGAYRLAEDHRVGLLVRLPEPLGECRLPVRLDRVDVERVAAVELVERVLGRALLFECGVVALLLAPAGDLVEAHPAAGQCHQKCHDEADPPTLAAGQREAAEAASAARSAPVLDLARIDTGTFVQLHGGTVPSDLDPYSVGTQRGAG